MSDPIVAQLRRAAAEIAEKDIPGWGNACRIAAERIEGLTSELARLTAAPEGEVVAWRIEFTLGNTTVTSDEAEANDFAALGLLVEPLDRHPEAGERAEITDAMIDRAARALVLVESDSTEEFEISWHKPETLQRSRAHARAALLAAFASPAGEREGAAPASPPISDAMRAVEFGEYLARAAESYMDVVNGEVTDGDTRTDAWKRLYAAIHEFRKRDPRLAELTATGGTTP